MKTTLFKIAFVFLTTSLTAGFSFADRSNADSSFGFSNLERQNILDELNPFDSNIEKTLKEMDQAYERETGQPAFQLDFNFSIEPKCHQLSCEVYVQVVKSEQRLYLYVQGVLQNSWVVSTGAAPKHETPLFNTNPNGRIYDRYTSSSFPGGDYNGLGNMPYAVFIQGGFALHGTVKSNWPMLGKKASHGCIRMHPDNAYIINRLIREAGVKNTWVSVQN